MGRAPFFVLEGIDGAGTTTQTARLAEALRARNIRVHTTREPSDGPIGALLRQILTGRVVTPGAAGPLRAAKLGLLFAADRVDHLEVEVLPRLALGECVVSDRYDHSTVAYQSVSARDPDSIPWLLELNRFAQRPDLTIVLDVSPEVARARRLARSSTKELFDDDDLQGRLARFYAEIDQHFPGETIAHVSADRDVDVVFAEVLALALPFFDSEPGSHKE
jgi:dTMP kinase